MSHTKHRETRPHTNTDTHKRARTHTHTDRHTHTSTHEHTRTHRHIHTHADTQHTKKASAGDGSACLGGNTAFATEIVGIAVGRECVPVCLCPCVSVSCVVCVHARPCVSCVCNAAFVTEIVGITVGRECVPVCLCPCVSRVRVCLRVCVVCRVRARACVVCVCTRGHVCRVYVTQLSPLKSSESLLAVSVCQSVSCVVQARRALQVPAVGVKVAHARSPDAQKLTHTHTDVCVRVEAYQQH